MTANGHFMLAAAGQIQRRGTVDMASTRGVAQLLLRPEEMAQALGIGRTTVFELMRRASCGR
jgi:hypothetical protein